MAALEALTSPVRDEEIDVMRKEYDERRKIMVDGFRNMGLDVTEPEGAFYVFPSIKKTGLTSMEFCNRLLAGTEGGSHSGRRIWKLCRGLHPLLLCLFQRHY